MRDGGRSLYARAGVDRSGRGCNPRPAFLTGAFEGWGFGVLGYNWGVMCFGKIFADGRNPQQGRRMNVRGKFAASAASAACAAAIAAAIAISATFNSAAHADHFGGINDTDESYRFSFDGTVWDWCEAEGVGGTYFRVLCYPEASFVTRDRTAVCQFSEEEAYAVQGQVTMIAGCRTDFNHHNFSGGGDEEGVFPTQCYSVADGGFVDLGNTPLCHHARPECAEGVEYTIAGNPLSGCPSACPAEQTENEAGECVCPSGRIKSLDSATCLMESEECPSGQVSDGDSENPQCVLMCAPFLGDNSPNPQAVLISLQSPVVSLVSGRDGDDNFACRCPAGQVIRRDAQGRWECTEAECHRRFLITDPGDDTLQICATENVGGCTIGNGYAGDVSLPRRGDVSNGDAALLCDVRNRNRFSGHQTDNRLLFHTDATLRSAHGFPRCDIIAPGGLTRGGYGSRTTPRQTFLWNNCADGSENTDTGTGCMVCEEGFFFIRRVHVRGGGDGVVFGVGRGDGSGKFGRVGAGERGGCSSGGDGDIYGGAGFGGLLCFGLGRRLRGKRGAVRGFGRGANSGMRGAGFGGFFNGGVFFARGGFGYVFGGGGRGDAFGACWRGCGVGGGGCAGWGDFGLDGAARGGLLRVGVAGSLRGSGVSWGCGGAGRGGWVSVSGCDGGGFGGGCFFRGRGAWGLGGLRMGGFGLRAGGLRWMILGRRTREGRRFGLRMGRG